MWLIYENYVSSETSETFLRICFDFNDPIIPSITRADINSPRRRNTTISQSPIIAIEILICLYHIHEGVIKFHLIEPGIFQGH